jgi:hypothetical protein
VERNIRSLSFFLASLIMLFKFEVYEKMLN